MNRLDLIRNVADRVGLPRSDVRAVLLETLREVAEGLRQEGRVGLRSFGSFEVKERAARTGRDPRDGSPIPIAATRTVAFKPSPALKKYIGVPRSHRPRGRLV